MSTSTETSKKELAPDEGATDKPRTGSLALVIDSAFDSADSEVPEWQQAEQTRLEFMATYSERHDPVRSFIYNAIQGAIDGIDQSELGLRMSEHTVVYGKHGYEVLADEQNPPTLTIDKYVNINTDEGVRLLKLHIVIEGKWSKDLANAKDYLVGKEENLNYIQADLNNNHKEATKSRSKIYKKMVKIAEDLKQEIVKSTAKLRSDNIQSIVENPTSLKIDVFALDVDNPKSDTANAKEVVLPWSGNTMFAKQIEGASLDIAMPDTAADAFAKITELEKPWEELDAEQAKEASKKVLNGVKIKKDIPQLEQPVMDEYMTLIMQSYV